MTRYNTVGRVATTVASDDNGFIDVTYHSTVVVHFNEDLIRLDSDGWYSNTTKVRMNQAANQFGLKFGVFQQKHQWYVHFMGKTFPYCDKMTLDRKTGKVYGKTFWNWAGDEIEPIEAK